jgi:hypothetical protein
MLSLLTTIPIGSIGIMLSRTVFNENNGFYGLARIFICICISITYRYLFVLNGQEEENILRHEN